MRPILPSQEDKWKLMVHQDPHSGSVAGDSGHGTMVMTSEAEPVDSNEAMDGIDEDVLAWIDEDVSAGINENVLAGYLSDVEWKEEDPLIEINDENVTIPQMPGAALTRSALLCSVQASTENEMFSPLELPMGKKPCFQE